MTKIYDMSWDEVMLRMKRILPPVIGFKVYGVPRGGAIVAGLMKSAHPDIVMCEYPEHADLIVDDIIDSGKTMGRFTGMRGHFSALVDRRVDGDSSLGWIRFPWEPHDPISDITDTVVRQLQVIGEDPTRSGLQDTPRRYLKALKEMTQGLHMDPREPLERTFDENHDEIVSVRGIDFTSLCEHHLLPFSGTVDFAYLPDGKVVGLSKIPRFIHVLSRRPQVQEKLTTQIADTFMEVLNPRGVMVKVTASHACMRLRGIRSHGEMVTSVVRGVFKDKAEARAEALALFQRG
jgi:GTP cyclohydrolase I